jgi:magnesium transporter
MLDVEQQEPWRRIAAALSGHDRAGLDALLEEFSPGEVARALNRLDEEQRQQFLILLEPEDAADFIEELTDAHAADLIEELPAEQAAAIVDEMESDHRADLLGELDEEDAEAILQRMDPEEAEDARELLEHDPDTAGGIMVTEYLAYSQDMRVSEVVADMRVNAERYSDFGVQYAYVESDRGTLVGVLRLRDLLLAPQQNPIREIMISNPVYVLAETPIEELDRLFERYPFWGMPVTDDEGLMIGVVRRADLEQALIEEQEKTFLRFSGIIGGEELRSMPLRERASRRLVWLSLNVVLSIAAASVVLMFEGTVMRVFPLVFFIPIIANISGCSGNQAVAVSIRELTLGLTCPEDFFRVWIKEVMVGAINGFVLGCCIGLVAVVLNQWMWHQSAYLGVVVAVAFMLNSLVAVSLGGVIPLALRAIKADPALGAPPMLTTLTDMFGFLFVLSLATLAIKAGYL